MDPIGWIRDRFYHLSDAIYARIPAQPRLQRFGLRLVLTMLMAGHRFRRMRGFGAATELAYQTLFALVPVTALILMMMTRLIASPEFISREVLPHLIPTSSQTVSDYIRDFSQAASAIGAISLILFAVTAISLLMSVEDAVNTLWNIRTPRSLLVKIGACSVLLMAGPLLIAASVYLTDEVLITLISRKIFGWTQPPYALSYGLSLLFTLIVFFLVYYKLPNTRVFPAAALLGAVIAGGVWECAKHLFDWYIGQAVTYHVIYGSLSIIPLFLLWLYLSWLIVLWGSQIAYIWQYMPALKSRSMPEPMTEWDRVNRAIRMLVYLADRYRISGGRVSVERLLDDMQADQHEMREILSALYRAGLIIVFKDEEETCFLARSPEEIDLYGVVALFDDFTPGPLADRNDALEQEIDLIGQRMQEGMRDRLAGITLDTLLQATDPTRLTVESKDEG